MAPARGGRRPWSSGRPTLLAPACPERASRPPLARAGLELRPTTLAWPSSPARPPQLVQAAVARQAVAARPGRRQRSPGRRQARAPMAVAACLALLAPPSWFELVPSRDTPWKHTIQMSSKRQTFKQKILPEYSTDSNKIWTIDARSQDLIDPGKRS